MADNTPTRIFLIEDTSSDIALLRHCLSESKLIRHELTTASRLQTACDILRNETFDIVLLDLSLPDAVHLDTVKVVRATAPSLPIIVLTGLDDEEVAIQAIQNGAQDYLLKGEINSRQLVRSINYATERNKLVKKLEEALENIKVLKGLLPICALCKKIRDDKGYWNEVESYIKDRSDAEFTHGYCPGCFEKEMDKFS